MKVILHKRGKEAQASVAIVGTDDFFSMPAVPDLSAAEIIGNIGGFEIEGNLHGFTGFYAGRIQPFSGNSKGNVDGFN